MVPAPPDRPVYFLDENIAGATLASRLRAVGMRCVELRDEFAPGTPDVVWIPEVARRGWWTLSRDTSMRRRDLEIAAIRRAQAIHVWILGHHLTLDALAELVIASRPRRENYVHKRTAPLVLGIHPDGRIRPIEGGQRRGGARK